MLYKLFCLINKILIYILKQLKQLYMKIILMDIKYIILQLLNKILNYKILIKMQMNIKMPLKDKQHMSNQK